MRAMECPLEGHHLEADNDEELFKATRKHADEVHPEQGFTDEQLRSIHRGKRLREVANQYLGLGHNTPALPLALYSPECVEGVFCELPPDGVLRS